MRQRKFDPPTTTQARCVCCKPGRPPCRRHPPPNEATEGAVGRAAAALAGPPRCNCPDDWREDSPERTARCPQHGAGDWPPAYVTKQARAALNAADEGPLYG